MIRRLGMSMALALALATTGCTVDAEAPWGRLVDGWSPISGPVQYSRVELGAALPAGRHQMHQLAVSAACRDADRLCRAADDPDYAFHLRTKIAFGSTWFLMSVWPGDRPRSWRRFLRHRCPDGSIEDPIRWKSDHEVTLGERGTGKRSRFELRGWTGVHCIRDVEFVYPMGWDETDGPQASRSAYVIVTNGVHRLLVQAEPVALARRVADEYLSRLGR